MKSTKKSLLVSALSLILCVAMLLGTTYAWFTDEVKSGTNTIEAGNLDIELEYSKTGADGSWKTVAGATELFADVSLWEPGATSVVYLKLTNKGTLALKYRLAINATGGEFTNVKGETKNLKNALKFAQIAGANLVTYANRDEAVAATSSAALGLQDYAQANHMAPNDVSYITLVVTMPTTIDNEFNYKTGTPAPVINLGIDLTATQYTAESDSFDKYYDVMATPIDVYTVEEFNEALKQAESGATINIMTAGLDLTVAYEDEKTFTLKGEKINKLTANIPNGTIHVYNEVDTVIGTNVDLENSAHFYNKVGTLNATAGHFVVEAGSVVETINTPATVEKELKIEIKGAVATFNVVEADTKIAVDVVAGATVTAMSIEGEGKIVLHNDGTIGNEGEIKAKTQIAADIAEDDKVMTINNVGEFKAFAKEVNGGNNYRNWTVKLGNDIDLNGVEWTPIGRTSRFEGTFDGQNHTIKNLTSVLDSTSATMYGNGLFGDITGGAVLKNFVVENADIHDAVDGKGNVYGIVCGYAYGNATFENITVKNSKISAFGKVAAILGMAADAGGTTTIKNCKVENTEITGAYNCATFAGLTQNAVVMSGNTQSNVTFKYSSRYGAECYTDVDSTATSGESVNGKYWKYTDAIYYAAWADLYNEQKETKIMDGTVTIDALVHGVTRTVTPVGEQTMEQALKSAITEAKPGDTVALGEDTVITEATKMDKDITLSGGEIAPTSESAVPVSVSGKGTSAVLNDVKVVADKTKAVDVGDNAKIVIDGGEVSRKTTSGNESAFNQLIMGNDNAEIELTDGTFENTVGNYTSIVKLDDVGGKVGISGGDFKTGDTSKSQAKVIHLDSDVVGEVNISGGDYVVQGSHGAVVAGGKAGTTVVIDGGNFKVGSVGVLVNSNVAQVIVNDCNYVSDMSISSGTPTYSYVFNVSGDARVTVKGGTFTLDLTADTVRINAITNPITCVILEGGTFNVQPSLSATIAAGFHEVNNGDGTWTVVAD